jgi:hypothetical protein
MKIPMRKKNLISRKPTKGRLKRRKILIDKGRIYIPMKTIAHQMIVIVK